MHNLLQFTLLSNLQEYNKGIKWGLPVHELQAQPPKLSYSKLKDKSSAEQKKTEPEVSWLPALPYDPIALRPGPVASVLRRLQQVVAASLQLFTCHLWGRKKEVVPAGEKSKWAKETQAQSSVEDMRSTTWQIAGQIPLISWRGGGGHAPSRVCRTELLLHEFYNST